MRFKTFIDQTQPYYNYIRLLSEALKIKTFSEIRDLTLQGLTHSPYFSTEQKMAIKIIALQMNAGFMEHECDRILMEILDTSWDSDVEEMGVIALTPEQRVGIINGIMDVCRYVIALEMQRLNNLVTAETVLPDRWYCEEGDDGDEENNETYSYSYGYGYNGNYEYQYGYGYSSETTDFFYVFGV